MKETEDSTTRVEIVLDVICAASYLAYVRLARAIERVRADGGKVEVTFRPFQLAPNASFDGEPLLEVLTRMFGTHVVAETEQAAADALHDGVTLDYGRAVAADTFEAHRLIASAAAQGLGEAMVERLFRAHFTDGLNIANPTTLAQLADEVGIGANDVPADRLRRDLARVRARGIRSVPQISFDGGPALAGTQPEQTYARALRRADAMR
ncbi:DsbA family oxidoreductase [Plantactinospora soyae]|uniref:DsbA family dithiol-disulfide isomerase n=1 Tax=Plantactinospora soyae TaxID=1544732 RepID=A0A927MD04_9ACTN|nr:DsbA family oxidoreductase [Plantactinospora soyae]MBE1490871.1 putative DsbA family dithiol-disulfide isomerase [Plantactinospora soyae]